MLPVLWSRFFRKRGSRQCGVTAIAFAKGGICLANVRVTGPGEASLHYCGFSPCVEDDRGGELAALVKALGLSGSYGRLVLNQSDYRMFQTPAPEVPLSEVREALRWRLQELLDFPAEEAEIEYFPIPNPQQSGRGDIVNAVICRKSLLEYYSALCKGAGLELDVVDIRELALRNLALRLPESDRGVALLYLEDARGMLHIQKGNMLYISRALDFGVRQMESVLADGEYDYGEGIISRLALEIQRSLDYYESHFGMPPIAGLVLAPIKDNAQALADRLIQALGVMNRIMDVSTLIHCRERLDDLTQQQCLPAIGAALRRTSGA